MLQICVVGYEKLGTLKENQNQHVYLVFRCIIIQIIWNWHISGVVPPFIFPY